MCSSREVKKNNIILSKLKKPGAFIVRLEGETYTAPYSKKTCVWFEWIHSKGSKLDNGYSFGYGTGQESPITVKSTFEDLIVYPNRIMLYLKPSFEGKTILDGKEQYIKEFCLEPDSTYYAFSEKFTYNLPPLRFLPFIPRQKTIWLLALSDKPLENDCPLQPLIPTRKGMTD